jgi:hypothetical protein
MTPAALPLRGDALPRPGAQEGSLPPGIGFLCPRCGDVGELLQNRCQCRRCLLVFTPPRIPGWVVRALWEGMAGGNPGQARGGEGGWLG